MAIHEKRGSAFSQIQVEQGLHQAAALAAMTLLITAHRALMNTGFTLRQKGLSTDAMISLTIGSLTCIWTSLVILSGFLLGDKPCRSQFGRCAARLAYAPWMMQILFFFWIVAYVNELSYLRLKVRSQAGSPAQVDIESTMKRTSALQRISRFFKRTRWRIWKMECSHGPFNWTGSIRPAFRWTLFATIGSVVLVLSYKAIEQKLYTVGLLNIVGVVLFMVGAAGANKYVTAPHFYTADTLRVVLHTRHKEGTVYILPHRDRGFHAVWSPKIESEHKALDEAVARAADDEGRHYTTSKLMSMDDVLASFNASTKLTMDEVTQLAGWLYEPQKYPTIQKMACVRAPGIHLISKNLMDSLWHAEYLVFMRQAKLSDHLKKKVGTLRSPRHTGLDLDRGSTQIGNKPGIQGYQEAVRYVYSLFGEPVDQSALLPTSQAPKTSVILEPCPSTIEEYVGQLWDHCFRTSESTFAALTAFTTHYQSDIGNDVVNGWHGFPLRTRDRDGDIVSWHVIWRQAWYVVVIAQLTSMSPIILSAFVAGVLQ